jgi:hypothetical protein
VEEGHKPSIIAGGPLWLQLQPDRIGALWQQLRRDLLDVEQDWQVWTTWYDDRLRGRPIHRERELVYVQIEQTLWDQGPAIVNAEIRRRIEELEPPQNGVVNFSITSGARASAGAVIVEHAAAVSLPPEPSPEIGPSLQVTERGLEIVSPASEEMFDEELQKVLHHRLRSLLTALKDATHRVANAHPALDHVISEYSDLIAQPFDKLDVASVWAVGTGLLAFRAAFANQASGTMTEPLEPGHLALLQQAAEIHGGFILGFPKGRELTDRADHARLSPEIIAQIAPSTRQILEGLARASNFVETRTRKFLAVVHENLVVHGWEVARTGTPPTRSPEIPSSHWARS